MRVWSHDQTKAPLKVDDLNRIFAGAHDRFTFTDAHDTPVPISERFKRTVFVGIGGTGQKVLRRLKARMSQYGVSKLPCFAMLGIDTTPQETINDFNLECALDAQEYICAQVSAPARFLDMVHANWRGESTYQGELASWLPREFGVQAIMAGAFTRRAAGRFAFFVNADMINRTLQAVVNRVSSADVEGKMEDLRLRLASDSPTRVYIICSVCGGTGSGMFLDTAYVLRRLLSDQFPQDIETHGVLVTDFPGASNALRANAYAALTELNYFTLDDTRFTAQYPGGFEVNTTEPPFSLAYLLASTSEGGEVIRSIDDLTDMIAESLFCMACTEASGTFDEALVGFAGRAPVSAEGALRGSRPAHFSSMGLQTIAIPKQWILDRWGSDLCARILEGMISGSEGLTDKPITAARDVVTAIGARSADTYAPIQACLTEMSAYVAQVLRADLAGATMDALPFWMDQLRKQVVTELPGVIEEKCLSVLSESIAQFEQAIFREANQIYADPEAGGYVAGSQFIQKILADIATLKSDIIEVSDRTVKPAEMLIDRLDRIEASATSRHRLLGPKPDPKGISVQFKNALRELIYNDWRRSTYAGALCELDAVEARLRQAQSDMAPALKRLEQVRAQFIEDRERTPSTPHGLPVHTKSALSEVDVERLYAMHLGDSTSERQLFMSSLGSSLSDLTRLSDAQLRYALKAYAAVRLEQTVFSSSLAQILKDSTGGDRGRMHSLIQATYARTSVYWTINPALPPLPGTLAVMSVNDTEDGSVAEAWRAAAIPGQAYWAAHQTAIRDRIWFLKTSHLARLDALTDLGRCWRSFDDATRNEGTTYLFSNRRHPELMMDHMVRPSDKPSYANNPIIWVRALSYGIVLKSTDPKTMDMYLVSVRDVSGRVTVIELAKSRVDAYEKLVRNERTLKLAQAAVMESEQKPARDRHPVLQRQATEVESLLNSSHSLDERTRELLRMELSLLSKEIAATAAESV